jgi:hypothetical protein
VKSEDKPIFIIGNPRSGTTMLRLMLTCHPNIAIPPEGGFAVSLYWKYGRSRAFSPEIIQRFVKDYYLVDGQIEWGLTPSMLLRTLARTSIQQYSDLVAAVYRLYSQIQFPGERKSRWGDKNNHYLHHIPLLSSMFPNAQFVHIVRDGRDVFCSYQNVPFLSSKDVIEVAFEWLYNVTTLQRDLAATNYIEVKYEDVVQSPEQEMQRVCELLGESYSEKMLNFAKENRERHLEPARKLSWKQLTLEGITHKQVNRWQRILSQGDRLLFECIARSQLQHYGYVLEGGAPTFTGKVYTRLGKIRFGFTRIVPLRVYKAAPYFAKSLYHQLRHSLKSVQ